MSGTRTLSPLLKRQRAVIAECPLRTRANKGGCGPPQPNLSQGKSTTWPRYSGAFPCQFLLQDRSTENRRIPRISIRYRELHATSMQHAPGRMFQVCSIGNQPFKSVSFQLEGLWFESWRTTHHLGIVRLTERELADQKRSRLSRGEFTPFAGDVDPGAPGQGHVNALAAVELVLVALHNELTNATGPRLR